MDAQPGNPSAHSQSESACEPRFEEDHDTNKQNSHLEGVLIEDDRRKVPMQVNAEANKAHSPAVYSHL